MCTIPQEVLVTTAQPRSSMHFYPQAVGGHATTPSNRAVCDNTNTRLPTAVLDGKVLGVLLGSDKLLTNGKSTKIHLYQMISSVRERTSCRVGSIGIRLYGLITAVRQF